MQAKQSLIWQLPSKRSFQKGIIRTSEQYLPKMHLLASVLPKSVHPKRIHPQSNFLTSIFSERVLSRSYPPKKHLSKLCLIETYLARKYPKVAQTAPPVPEHVLQKSICSKVRPTKDSQHISANTDLAMGQNPVPPVNIPIATKID